MSFALQDQADRVRAVREFGRNLVVTAGAGTGKTSLLVGRLLTALVKLEVEPRAILAVTFTENAAIEMRERIARLLRNVGPFVRGEPLESESDRPTLELVGLGPGHVRRAEDVLAVADRLPISTFHGFCLGLLEQHAARFDLPPGLAIGDSAQEWQSFSRAFLSFLREIEGDVPRAALERFDPAELRKLAWELLSVPADLLDSALDAPPLEDVERDRAAASRLLDDHPGALPAFRSCAQSVVDAYDWVAGHRETKPERLPPRAARPGRTVAEPRRSEVVAELQAHLDRLRPLIEADDEGIAVALEFVRPLVERYRRERRRRGELSFDDLLLLVRERLIADAELRRRAGAGLAAILVDEFQDTDPLQYDIVFLLAAEPVTGAVDDPLAVRLRPDVLFLVGDAKQSIYRFRRADVAAFARATDAVVAQGGDRLRLVSNFRSAAPILELVNRVCERTLVESRPYQLGYDPVVATRGAARAVAQEVLVPSGSGALSSPDRRMLEGRVVVQKLDELARDGIGFGDMAVLLRAAAETSWLLRPLRQAGIPFVLEGSRRFYQRHEIVLATALIGAMARPHDPVPVLGILRSAWSRATDAEIRAFLERHGSLDFRRTARGRGSVHRALAMLRDLRAEVAGLPLDRALARLLCHEAWTITEGTGFEGAQRLANLERLLDLLTNGRHGDLHEVSEFLERNARVETEDEESPLFDLDVDAVRVLTVHAAKGLEFGAVIVPDLARRHFVHERFEDARVERLFDGDGDELVGVRIGASRNAHSFRVESANQEHRTAEERRLFYVAATRARDYLGLVCSAEPHGRSLWQADLVDALGVDPADERSQLEVRGVEARPAASRAEPAAAIAAARAHDEAIEEIARRTPAATLSPSAAAGVTGTADLPLFGRARKGAIDADQPSERTAALHLGSLAHRYLALVDYARERPDRELTRALAAEPPDVGDALDRLADAFHGSELRERMLAATVVRREVPIAYADDDGRCIAGAIDLLLQEADGSWTVLDHKTDRILGRAHASVAAIYRPQLESYGEGVRRALALDHRPRLEVWFARDDVCVAL